MPDVWYLINRWEIYSRWNQRKRIIYSLILFYTLIVSKLSSSILRRIQRVHVIVGINHVSYLRRVNWSIREIAISIPLTAIFVWSLSTFVSINHRAERYPLSELRPQGAPPAKDTDPGMAASVQLEQTSAGYFGRVDSGFDRDTAGHSVCDSGWTSSSGAYAARSSYAGVLVTRELCPLNDIPIKTASQISALSRITITSRGNRITGTVTWRAPVKLIKLFRASYRFIHNAIANKVALDDRALTSPAN